MFQCKYKIGKLLGEGTYGKAYLVSNLDSNQNYAYKTILIDKDDKISKISNPIELDIMFRLNSPNLLKGIDITIPGECTNEFGIVSEYLEEDTEDLVGKMNLEERLSIPRTS
jgi:serine/threonine protein kinase